MTKEAQAILLGKARACVRKRAPYWALYVDSFIYLETPSMETMSVSEHLQLRYNPEWIMTLAVEELAGVLVHEIMHHMSDHHRRGQHVWATDPDRANRAADLAINPVLEHAGWRLPEDRLHPDQYGLPPFLSMEEYYDRLPHAPDKPFGRACSGGCGGVSGNPHPSESEHSADTDPEQGEGAGAEPPPIRTSLEQRQLQIRTAEGLREYRGSLPGPLAGFFREFCDAVLTPPVVPWADVLGYFVREAGEAAQRGSAEYSLRRLAKSSYLRGIPLPGLVEFPPYIGIAIDTSASMRVEDLSRALGEIRGILECLQLSHVWVCQADVSVRVPFTLMAIEDLTSVGLEGRGGTSFDDVFREVREVHPEMSVLVYFTDGEAFPPTKPDNLHVCWCLTRKGQTAPASWGDVVYME